jgi:hypothetical protein
MTCQLGLRTLMLSLVPINRPGIGGNRPGPGHEEITLMSAFMVSTDHIDAIVCVAINGPKGGESRWEGPRWAEGDPRIVPWPEQIWREVSVARTSNPFGSVGTITPDELGQMLCDENRRSLDYRYNEINEPVEYSYRKPSRRPTIAEAFKLLDCFEYQACETPDFEDSEAYRFMQCLRGSLIGSLPGYNAAPWEWSATTA